MISCYFCKNNVHSPKPPYLSFTMTNKLKTQLIVITCRTCYGVHKDDFLDVEMNLLKPVSYSANYKLPAIRRLEDKSKRGNGVVIVLINKSCSTDKIILKPSD